jgi:hypothetical protein
MKENNIDKLFKEKLATHIVTPPPQAWEKINASLNQRKRRAVIAWRMAAGVALVGGLSWWFVNNQETAKTTDFIAKQPVTTPLQEKNQVEKLNHATDNQVDTNKELAKQESFANNNVAKNSTTTPIIEVQKQKVTQKFTPKNVVKELQKQEEKATNFETIAATKENKKLDSVSQNIIQNTTQNTTLLALQNTEKQEVKETEVLEVIVKLDAGNETETTKNSVAKVEEKAKKRTFLNRIWSKVKEGETLTLQDMGVNTKKVAKILRQE